MARKMQADLVVDRAASQLRLLLQEAARELRPFPPFPGAFFTCAVEVNLEGVERPDLGCIVVAEDSELYELEMQIDFSEEFGGVIDPGQAFGTVESVKAVSEVFAPVGGTVAAINEELSKKPELINSEPHTAWLITATVSDPKAIEHLMDAAAYQQFIATQEAGH